MNLKRLIIIDTDVKCRDGTLAIDRLRAAICEVFEGEPETIRALFRVFDAQKDGGGARE